jgi:DNA-binding GntR family transcriptional regulator
MHRLAEEGLIEIVPNRGAVVIGIGDEELVDIYKIRIRLEGLASSEAAKRISEDDLKRLRDSVELSEFYIAKQDAEHLKELDSEFHNIIYKASGNRLLCKTLTELHRNIKFYRKRSLGVANRLEKSIAEHREILSAIESGDSEAADRVTSAHIEAALNNLLSVKDN